MMMIANHYSLDTVPRPSHESPHLIFLQPQEVDTTLILLMREWRLRGAQWLAQGQITNVMLEIIKQEV